MIRLRLHEPRWGRQRWSWLLVAAFAVTASACGQVAPPASEAIPAAPAAPPSPASVDGEGPMRYDANPRGNAVGRTFDLCDDSAAITAGLDGGALNSDRQAMGIDCASPSSSMRFGHRSVTGELALGATPAAAQAAADDIAIDPNNEEARRAVEAPPGRALGHFGRLSSAPDAMGNRPVVLNDTITVTETSIRGLVHNASTTRSAKRLTVSLGSSKWVMPFTVQPGESAPFELDWTDAGPPVLEALAVRAVMTPNVDLGRTIYVSGAPGRWFGTADQFPGPAGILNTLPAGEFEYFESTLQVVVPTSGAAIANPSAGLSVRDIRGFVAFFDLDGRVLDVVDVESFRMTGDGRAVKAGGLARGEMNTIGFVIPREAADFSIWIGGNS